MYAYEPTSQRYFKIDQAKLAKVQEDISRQYISGEKMTWTLNELYEALGLAPSLMGWNYGFDLHDGPLHICAPIDEGSDENVTLSYSLETKLLSMSAAIEEPKSADIPSEEEGAPKKRRAYSGTRTDHRNMLAIDQSAFFNTLEACGITLWRLCQENNFCRSASTVYRQVHDGWIDAHILCEIADALRVDAAQLVRDENSPSRYNAHITLLMIDSQAGVDPEVAKGLQDAIDEAVNRYLWEHPLDDGTAIIWNACDRLPKGAKMI